MAGIDAPSTDLTARIRARRAAEVRAGLIEPALPGERQVYGTQSDAPDRIDLVMRAAAARERRSVRAGEVEPEGKVYEMEYLPGELELSTEDGGDSIEEAETDESLADVLDPDGDELAVYAERQFAEGVLTAPTDTPMRLAVIEEQLTGISAALVLIAERVGSTPAEVVKAVAALAAAPSADPRPPVGMIRRFFRWLW